MLYLDKGADTVYDIPTTAFMPTFAFARELPDLSIVDINNLTDWNVGFIISYFNGTRVDVEAVNCEDVINGWTDVS